MLIDLLTKYLVSNYLTFKEIIPDFFNIYLTHNSGAAFSILKNSQIILIIISIFVLFYIIKYMIPKVRSNMEYISISMIIGGTLGNLFDRIYNNYVIDFISLNIFEYNFLESFFVYKITFNNICFKNKWYKQWLNSNLFIFKFFAKFIK